MPVPLSKHMNLSIDVAIHLQGSGLSKAVINRELVDLLLAIEATASVQKACEQLNLTTRSAQRTLKRFAEGSGLQLLEYHGWQGTNLTDEGRQCIALYVAARGCVEQIVRESAFPRPLPPLMNYPAPSDWEHREIH